MRKIDWAILIVAFGCLIYGICVGYDYANGAYGSSRYTVKVDPAVYVAPYDANDPAYKLLAKVPADWLVRYGDNERTALLYNISLMRVNLKQLDDRLNSLLPPVIETPEVVDPNQVIQDAKDE